MNNNTFSPPKPETIIIERKRYDELVKKEEKLRLLTNALNSSTYWDIANLKAIFATEEKKGVNNR